MKRKSFKNDDIFYGILGLIILAALVGEGTKTAASQIKKQKRRGRAVHARPVIQHPNVELPGRAATASQDTMQATGFVAQRRGLIRFTLALLKKAALQLWKWVY